MIRGDIQQDGDAGFGPEHPVQLKAAYFQYIDIMIFGGDF